MGFAIYHGSKGKGSGGGVGAHIDRKKGMEHTYKHADPGKLLLNKNLIPKNEFSGMKLSDAINEKIKDGYKGKRAPRRDAVKYISHVLTGSHEDMKRIFKNQEEKKAWLQKNYNFIRDEFGAENIVRFTLHLDEKTPHVHAITVPLTEDGRLSAKEIYGNKEALTARQDRYAEQMKEFGLERGLKRTGIKHENAKDYYTRIKQAQNNVDMDVREPSKNMLGVYKEDSVQEMQNALKSANLALSDLKAKYERERIKSRSKELSEVRASGTLQKKEKEVVQLRKKQQELLKNARAIIMDPEQTEMLRNKFIEEDRTKEQEKTKNRGRGFIR
jgi:hypothetical protein|tara:strand:+ start:957 stop:1943 length:987 start_codon:yes stop_codon:yes gene_type:complete